MDWSSLAVPLWADTDEAKCFFYGFAVGATVRIFRAACKWFKNAEGRERGGD